MALFLMNRLVLLKLKDSNDESSVAHLVVFEMMKFLIS